MLALAYPALEIPQPKTPARRAKTRPQRMESSAAELLDNQRMEFE
jgi:hypothetical protein